MGANFVQLGDETLIDLTNDSVTPETLDEGVTAHDATGEPIVGTAPRLIVLDDESTAEEFTNAFNAYKIYGTTVLFAINSSDYGTLVYVKGNELYFMGDRILKATIGDTMSFAYVDIVNSENIVHTVASATAMSRIIENATEKDIGSSYLYCGETTDKYKHGVIYIIGEEDVNG